MTPSFDPVAALRDTDLFGGLAPQQLQALAAQTVTETFKPRATLFFAGDDPDGLRIVLGGLLRVWINDAEGREVTLTLTEPGEVLGELALLDGEPRSANVTAMDETRTLLIRRGPFQTLLETDRDLQRQLLVLLCARLRAVTENLGTIALLTLRRRLMRKLYDLAQTHAVPEGEGARFRRQFTQSELAALLGVTREAVNKQLSALTVDGLISTKNGVMRIARLEALAARD